VCVSVCVVCVSVCVYVCVILLTLYGVCRRGLDIDVAHWHLWLNKVGAGIGGYNGEYPLAVFWIMVPNIALGFKYTYP
jgi:hypothetical protein